MKKHQILGKPGAYEVLQFLETHHDSPRDQLVFYIEKIGVMEEDINERLDDLQKIGFVHKRFSRTKRTDLFRITDEGLEALLLVDVINGTCLSSVLDRLPSLSRKSFGLITSDITGYLLETLTYLNDFLYLYLCSPWIRLRNGDLDSLDYAFRRAQRMTGVYPRVSIITRPMERNETLQEDKRGIAWKQQIARTLLWFKERKADIVGHPNLHTKLYIIWGKERQVAIFGSENLTGVRNVELGIYVDDPVIINKLYRYWIEIYDASESVGDISHE